MKKLCVNYLSEVRELLEEGKIDFINYLKLFSLNGDLSPFDWCVNQKEVMFHGFAGHGGSNIADLNFFENRDFELQKDYYKRGNTPYISLHINRGSDDGNSEEECKKTIAKNIKEIRKIFDMRIILENVPASESRAYNKFFSMPEFISEVVRENNCGFLFDIGHARKAAETLNIPFEEYANRLPMDRCVEMHLAGVMIKKDGLIAPNHSKMHEEDYEFVKNALKKYPSIEVITLEYGPFVLNDLIEECPMVNYENINLVAKAEVYDQLLRLKEIIENYEQ